MMSLQSLILKSGTVLWGGYVLGRNAHPECTAKPMRKKFRKRLCIANLAGMPTIASLATSDLSWVLRSFDLMGLRTAVDYEGYKHATGEMVVFAERYRCCGR